VRFLSSERLGGGGRWLLVLLFALSLAFQLRVLDEKFLLGDEGVALMGGWRVSQGEVPHRDFFEIIPPVSFLPTAAVFRLFGPGILQARLLVLAYSLLLLLLVDRACSRLGASAWARLFPLALLTPFGVFFWPVPSHHWLADLFVLGALLALLRAIEPGTAAARWAALAGACTGLCGFSLQDQGAYFSMATCLLVLPWVPREGHLRRRIALGWLGGLASVASIVLLWLLPAVGWRALLDQWVLFPATRYRTVSTNVTGLFSGWEGVAGLWSSGAWSSRPSFSVGLTLCTAVVFLLPVAAAVSLFLAWRAPGPRRLTMGVLAAGAVACAGTAAHRWAITNLVWAAPGLLPPVVLGLSHALRSERRSIRWLGRVAAAVGVGAPLLFGTLYYFGVTPAHTATLHARAGTLQSVRIEEVRRIQETLDAIERFVPREAPLFCNGYTPLINFLSLRPNPTRFQFFFQPAYNTDAQAAEVIASLRARPDTWVLLTRPIQPGLAVESFVVAHYAPVWQNERAVLMRPHPSGLPGPGTAYEGRATEPPPGDGGR